MGATSDRGVLADLDALSALGDRLARLDQILTDVVGDVTRLARDIDAAVGADAAARAFRDGFGSAITVLLHDAVAAHAALAEHGESIRRGVDALSEGDQVSARHLVADRT
ncbi:hypothetical protein AAFP35_09015 [Gordonia sp. CPCC 206044]|uniref:hypothetical protein n=1 Tax=Gordonia sp. CPCC 206044 TaxID=3140793 RepID=UPI003AF36704